MKTAIAVLVSLLAISASANVILSLERAGQGEDAYKPYDAIFNGEVLEIKDGPGEDETVTFYITKLIKQRTEKGLDLDYNELVKVSSDGVSPHCFFDFEQGRIYAVYSRLDESGALVTNACWGTHPYSRGGTIHADYKVYPVPWEKCADLDEPAKSSCEADSWR